MRKRILIADNNDITRESMAIILSRHRSIDIQQVKTGEEALKKIHAWKPNLLFLDIDFGDHHKDGIEICQEIKSDPNYRDIFVVIVSGRDDKKTIEKAMLAGADEYLLKPWYPPQLKDILEQVCENTTP